MDSAIATAEGFGTPNATTINAANNPGAILYGPFAQSQGATGSLMSGAGANLAVFPTVAQGESAEDALVGEYAANGLTLQQLGQTWACGSDTTCQSSQANQNYVSTLAQQTGVPATTPLTSLSGANPGSPPATTGSAASNAITNAFTWGGMLNPSTWNPFSSSSGSNPSSSSSTSGFSWGRIGAFLLGLIVIAGAIYLFKDVREAVNSGGKSLVTAASI